jgi:hypothetical protein
MYTCTCIHYVRTYTRTYSCEAKAFEAFELMASKGVSGLAVVDDDGKIIQNTSATDLKVCMCMCKRIYVVCVCVCKINVRMKDVSDSRRSGRLSRERAPLISRYAYLCCVCVCVCV